jgi:hypothetical protein
MVAAATGIVAAGWAVPDAAAEGLPVDTTILDFFMPGTQPDPSGSVVSPVLDSLNCTLCHGNYDQAEPALPLDGEPYRNWAGSMMAQAARDPMFWAAMTVANQDANFGGDFCLRCHSPAAWLGGRSEPTDGTGLQHSTADFEGVTCHVCHRLVNPVYVEGESPGVDEGILSDLDIDGHLPPADAHSGQYVVDPDDRRRGPFDLGGFGFHDWLQSPFHQQSALCGTCHDVSNPAYTKQPDGSYALNDLNTPHSVEMDKYEMFPIERTYSEWLQSQFADGGVVMDGRFGGNLPDTTPIESCQDCHMPDQVSPGCRVPGFADRPDMAAHFLNGGNTWVLLAIDDLYSDGDPDEPNGDPNDDVFMDELTGLTPDIISASIDRAIQMLRDASDMELTQLGSQLNVRITNMSGHKLPTGYPEGRRMWINVRFFDVNDVIVQEHGTYDYGTGVLTEADTKVYQTKLGLSPEVASDTGLPAGESFHFILNNVVLLDNRIPPMGFTNAGFEAVQSAPVGYAYADGAHWDDTVYAIPPDAVRAVVTLYYQTTSKEYVEFLQGANTTDNRGQIAYDMWQTYGKSALVDMDTVEIDLEAVVPGDLDGDGLVGVNDFLLLLAAWGLCLDPCPPTCPADIDGDCTVGITDFLIILANWS